ncbi:MAG: ATP-binding protein, partial [Cocleimonas sp.]|nr:ATP-binding protein [Cocleimonas sp.]
MEWMQTLKSYYIINIEPSLDAMSNGEATLFGFALTAVAGFLVWFSTKMLLWLGGQVYKRFQKESPEEEQEEQSSKLKPDTGKPTTPRPTPRPKPLPHTSNTKLFGRKKELSLLTRAWNNDKQNIVVLKAMGGTGKTALLKDWLDGFNDTSKRTPPDKIYTWSFYSQGSAEDKQASADVFFDEALAFFDYQGDSIASAHDKGFKLAELVNQQPTLLVLDGLEPLQNPVGVMHGDLKDKGLRALLQQLA